MNIPPPVNVSITPQTIATSFLMNNAALIVSDSSVGKYNHDPIPTIASEIDISNWFSTSYVAGPPMTTNIPAIRR